jgi:hypothetical protein
MSPLSPPRRKRRRRRVRRSRQREPRLAIPKGPDPVTVIHSPDHIEFIEDDGRGKVTSTRYTRAAWAEQVDAAFVADIELFDFAADAQKGNTDGTTHSR